VIKIGDGTQTSNILIGSNNTTPIGTDNVYIGASTKTVNINGTLKFNDGGGSLIMGSSGTSYISLGAQNTTFNIGGSTSPFNLSSPIKPQYSLSFTSDQIGYSSSSTVSGALTSGTTNTLLMGTLTGVYMVSVLSEVGSGGFVGISTYDFQVGLNAVGYKSRIFYAGSPIYSNNQQTIPYVYSSGGTPNPTSALLYSSIVLSFGSSTGTSPFWALTLYYTRVA
jgi:hypothetical protein